ncbi:cytochrome P450 [Paraburkholderia edwinii]|uniref:Cytochrome P450 n=1 Tax=Paraburkholderia edwinii TaxID=2861782 RepID=A0ABX8UVW1_9BURK|nr:cytochrome P450 [Paraburkholderia edwinii]QYD72457.1 cytochrome P450 [Paraburkholderia edwinii]
MKLADFATPEFFADPYPLYERLRNEGPLLTVGPKKMITGRYGVIEELFLNRQIGRNYLPSVRARYGEEGLRQPALLGFSRMLSQLNPPAHTHLRGLTIKAFNARQIGPLRDTAQAMAHRLIDSFAPRSHGTVDLIAAYAQPLPIAIISGMMDVPFEHSSHFSAALKQMFRLLEPMPLDSEELAKTNDAYLLLARYFGEVVDARRKRPGTDLVSLLISAEENGETLTHDEIVANVIMLYLGGHETTANMIGNTLIALQRHPQQFDALKSDPAKLPNAILECLRYDGSVQLTARMARADTEINGIRIPRDTHVFMALGAANRDPDKFYKPDQLDIERESPRPLTFGAGIHHCLGYRLALLELEVALGVLLSRLPSLALTGLEDLRWLPTSAIRGVEQLIVRW